MGLLTHCRSPGSSQGTVRAMVCAALAVVVISIVAYWPVQRNGFLFHDDEDYLTRNTVVRRGLTAEGIVLAFTKSYAANWHPLTWISHMIDVELFDLDPRAHHIVGFAIHLSTALLLLFTLQAMSGRAGPSFLVAALFAVHPLHVESVAWAAERKDVLCAFFWMLTTALYVRYARRPGLRRYIAVLLSFALGLLSKPMAVTLPLVLLLLDYWPLGRHRPGAEPGMSFPRRRCQALVLEKVPFLAMATLVGLVTLKSQGTAGAVRTLAVFPLAARVSNAILSPVRYLGKAIWPADLSIFYPFTVRSLTDPPVLAAGGLLAALSVAALLLRRQRPWLVTGWFWYLVTLLPVIGLLQVGEQAMADRYTYLPLVGVFVAGSWTLATAGFRKVVGGGVVVAVTVLLLLLAGITRRQVAFWRDDETLFQHAISVTEENWKAHYSLGMAREAAGDRAAAIRHYREAIRIKPDYPQVRYNYALALDEEGRTGEALDQLRIAARALPGEPAIRTAFVLLLSRVGLEDEAIANLREIIQLRPEIAESYNNLAAILARRGEVDEAVALLRRALQIDPTYADARLNLDALLGIRPDRAGFPEVPPGVPTTHRGLFGGSRGE